MNKQFLETIKIEGQKFHNLTYHQERVDRTIGTRILDLGSIISPKQTELTRCRIVYDETGRYTIEYIPYTKRNIQSLKLVFCDTIEYEKKYFDRLILDQLFEQRDGCDDIVIVKNSLVTDTTIANLAFYDGEQWFSPKTPLLEGTMRQKLLDEKKIIERDIHYTELNNFKKIALMNAMIGFDIILKENIEDIIC